MSDFERLGDVITGSAGRKKYERTFRGHSVEGRALSASSHTYQSDVLDGGQVDGYGNVVIPFPQRSLVQADVQQGMPPFPVVKDSPDSSVCPKCKGAGRLRRNVPIGHPDFGKAIACVCRERELREKRQRKMVALSEQFGFQRAQVLSSFRRQVNGVQEAYQEAKAMIDRLEAWARQRDGAKQTNDVLTLPQEWLLLRGPVGTGKTHLAMAIANACIDAGFVALFATVPDLLDYLRATYGPESDVTYDALFTQLRDAEVLVLDDLGTQRSSPWADEKIFQLINYRYNFGWPTVITLNKKAWTYLDERISSRLQDAGLVLLVDMEDAQDYRLRQGKNAARRRTPSAESSVNSEL